MIRLQILSGKQAGQIVLVRRFPFVIGRSPDAGLSLAEPGVWDHHCRIEYRAGSGFYLVGTSEVPTLVDELPAGSEHRLLNASLISLGAARLRFTLDDPVPRRLGTREAITWFFLASVIAFEGWLIWWLPR